MMPKSFALALHTTCGRVHAACGTVASTCHIQWHCRCQSTRLFGNSVRCQRCRHPPQAAAPSLLCHTGQSRGPCRPPWTAQPHQSLGSRTGGRQHAWPGSTQMSYLTGAQQHTNRGASNTTGHSTRLTRIAFEPFASHECDYFGNTQQATAHVSPTQTSRGLSHRVHQLLVCLAEESHGSSGYLSWACMAAWTAALLSRCHPSSWCHTTHVCHRDCCRQQTPGVLANSPEHHLHVLLSMSSVLRQTEQMLAQSLPRQAAC
jgi:hypothetical protein